MTDRCPRLSPFARTVYGLGLAAEGVMGSGFNVLLLFYYQQVIGLSPMLCGTALFVALCVDAITDPVVGMWSDGVRSRLGRRHPFMYASVVPVAACFYWVWTPPAGLGQGLLFAWLTALAVATRVSMTLFAIPHQALVAELAATPADRTSLQGLRVVFAWLFGLINTALAYVVFLASSAEYPRGLLDPRGYPSLAAFGACVMVIAIVTSSLGTQRAVLRRPREHAPGAAVSLRGLVEAMATALRSRSYRAALLGGLFLATAYGVYENLNNYMNTFFWGFDSEQIAFFLLVITLALFAVLGLARPLGARFGKRRVAMAAGFGFVTIIPIFVFLRFCGVLPPTGSAELLYLLSVPVFCAYLSLILGTVMIGSMIADVTDEHELATGRREEGLLFAASTFTGKASSGLGVLGASLAITAARLPSEGEVMDRAAIDMLALWNVGIVAVFGLLMIWAVRSYELDETRHGQIRERLARRHDA